MGIEGTRGNSTMRRLTDGLAFDLFFFGLLAIGCMLFLAGSIDRHFGVVSAATKVKEDLAGLPFAIGRPVGTRAILTGAIASDTEPLFKNFVVYIEEVYRGTGKYRTKDWEVRGRKLQTFRITTSTGDMYLAHSDYALSPAVSATHAPLLPEWDHVAARLEEPPGFFEGAKRFRGLVAGGPVTAVGTVTADGTFDADFVVGARLEDLKKSLDPVASGETSYFDYAMTILGLLGLALTIAMFIRARVKTAREDRTT